MCHANIYFGVWHVYSEKFRKSSLSLWHLYTHTYSIFSKLNSNTHSNYYCNVVVFFVHIWETKMCNGVWMCASGKSFHFPPFLSHLQVAALHLSKPWQIWSNCTFKLFFFLPFPFFQNDLFISSAHVVKATIFPWAHSCEKADSCFFPLKFDWDIFSSF